jgi:hypothetical protein
VQEHWSEHILEQAEEGCNIAGLVRVNKVIGSIQLSPGRSFQAARSRIYELVPYLKNDGNRHDFSHTVQYLYFTADDEADESKAQVSKEMRERLGIYRNPLDEHTARVRPRFESAMRPQRMRIDVTSAIHVPVLHQGCIDAIQYPRWPNCQFAPV